MATAIWTARAQARWAALWAGHHRVLGTSSPDVNVWCIHLGPACPKGFSPRQRKVVWRVASGAQNKEIARELGIAQSTVATYLAQAIAKMGLPDRRALLNLMPASLRGKRPKSMLWNILDARDDGSGTLELWAPPPALPENLTPAERDVLRLLLEGYDMVGIAIERCTSFRTVANQQTSLYRKLGVGGRNELDPALLPLLKPAARRRKHR